MVIKSWDQRQRSVFKTMPEVRQSSRTVDVQVFGLRKKLGETGKYIETVRGIGYRMQARRSELLGLRWQNVDFEEARG